jgi:hypothetical protein
MRLVVFALALLTLFTAALPVAANMRAPYHLDGTFSEHVRGAHPDALLRRERFHARLPEVVTGKHGQHLVAIIEVEYDIDNVSDVPLTLPVRFLAIGTRKALVRVNGAKVPYTPVHDVTERMQARVALAKHRCAWSAHDIKGMFFRTCDPAAPRDPTDDAKEADERYRRNLPWQEEDALDSVAFDVVLAPGPNTVRVEYAQRLRFREGSHGYFTGLGVRGAQYGFEYLLYPADAWRRADDFTFDVIVDVPDVRDRGWFDERFDDTLYVPKVHTNLPLVVRRQPHSATQLRGRLDAFPAAVFAVVVDVPVD